MSLLLACLDVVLSDRWRWTRWAAFIVSGLAASWACSGPSQGAPCGAGGCPADGSGARGGVGGIPTAGTGGSAGSNLAGASPAASGSGAVNEPVAEAGASDGAGGASGASEPGGGSGGADGAEQSGSGGTAVGGASGTAGEGGAPFFPVDCEFNVSSSISPAIATVGIVEWSSALEAIDAARIEFGPDTSYGMTAPVDLDEPDFRTLLLGMTANSEYHFRVVASSEGRECESDDFALETGPLPEDFPSFDVSVSNPDDVAEGFIVTSEVLAYGHVYVFNQRGELVWWYEPPILQVPRAKLSYDGKYMYIYRFNGGIVRVSMDGLEQESITLEGSHHDFTVTPDNGVAFLRTLPDEDCDQIAKLMPDGSVSVVFDVLDAYPPDAELARGCHANSLHYHVDDDTYTFSDLFQNNYVKITSAGDVVWRLGGDFSDFSGDGTDWYEQHGHHLLGPNRILIFSNSFGMGSPAIEISLDFESMTATQGFTYNSEYGSTILGDVQRLPNGNTLVTYSKAGVIQEVNTAGALVRELSFNSEFGYANHRPTLYGPPPKSR